MSRKRRMQDRAESKEKRMKKVAIGGAVVLVALLAYEVPHVMHRGGATPSAAATTTTTTTPGTTTTPSTLPTTTPGTAVAAVLPASLKLPNSDVAPERSKSQLYSFTRFSGKNPFVQQVTVPTSTPGSPTTTPTSTTPTSSGGGSTSSGGGSPTLSTAHAAMLSVNGKTQTVLVGTSFPHANPLFKLVSISHNVAKIGLVNGKFANGSKTVSLGVGKSLILVDKANNAHYQLKLLSVS